MMTTGNFFNRLQQTYMRRVWSEDLRALPPSRRWLVRNIRLIHNLVTEAVDGQLTVRAMSLVYTTLLALVPLLAVSFSVLKAFGVHNQLEPVLLNFLAPLGEKGMELGVGMLLYTVVSLVLMVEDAFNLFWHIDRPRQLVRRFSDYMSVILIGPVLVFSALGLTAAVMGTGLVQDIVAVEPIGYLVAIGGGLLPYALVCAAFVFVYVFIPNTKVHFDAALVAGVLAGVLWETCGWAFASFVVSSTQYTAIYSGFAIVIVFMIWLYVSWLILLLGAQIAYYHQHPELLRIRPGEGRLCNQARERLAVMLMLMIGYNYYYNRGWWTMERLAQELAVPPFALQRVLGTLEKGGFIGQSGDDPPSYFPARDIETIRLRSLLQTVRHADDDSYEGLDSRPEGDLVNAVMQRVDRSIGDGLADDTVKDLVLAQAAPVKEEKE